MGIEGISLTTVFNLLLGGFALATSVFLGAYFLEPAFSIDAVMASVAYDLATLYELAYTIPGDIDFFYYGPQACTWNTEQPSDSARSFHCFSAKAVVIKDVLVDKYDIYVYHDPYMVSDYVSERMSVPTQVITQRRSSFGMVKIPYWNKQFCDFQRSASGGITDFSYCSLAWAPFATNYKDFFFTYTDNVPFSYNVVNYSFTLGKERKQGYFDTVYEGDDFGSAGLVTLELFGAKLRDMYYCGCVGGDLESFECSLLELDDDYPYPLIHLGPRQEVSIGDIKIPVYHLPLRKGYRWRVYKDGEGDYSYICHERISLDEWYFPSLREELDCLFHMLVHYPLTLPVQNYRNFVFSDLAKFNPDLPPSSFYHCYDSINDEDYTRETESYLVVDENIYFKLGGYVPEYCFNVKEVMYDRCGNVTGVEFTPHALELFNDYNPNIDSYVWAAGYPSNVDLVFYYDNSSKKVFVNGTYSRYRVERGW